MTTLARLALVMMASAAAAGAAPPAPPEPEPDAAEPQAVEVVNRLDRAVDVSYYPAGGGGPLFLGTVSAASRQRFPLPSGAAFVIATDAAGFRVHAGNVDIRRVSLRQP